VFCTYVSVRLQRLRAPTRATVMNRSAQPQKTISFGTLGFATCVSLVKTKNPHVPTLSMLNTPMTSSTVE
jgi:hypothetical protein